MKYFYIILSMLLLQSCVSSHKETIVTYSSRIVYEQNILRSTENTVELTCEDIKHVKNTVKKEDILKKFVELYSVMLCE